MRKQNGVTHFFWFSNTGQDLRRNFSQFCEIFLYMPRNMEEQICQGKKKNSRHGKCEQGPESEMKLRALLKENSNYYSIN